jgi:hypothetical protein
VRGEGGAADGPAAAGARAAAHSGGNAPPRRGSGSPGPTRALLAPSLDPAPRPAPPRRPRLSRGRGRARGSRTYTAGRRQHYSRTSSHKQAA